MTINEYLSGLTAYDVTEEAVATILYRVGVQEEAVLDEITVRQRDLCEAYLYVWCAMLPTTTGSIEDSDSGWTHREGSKQISAADKNRLLKLANAIFAKYGLPLVSSGIRMQARGMRI